MNYTLSYNYNPQLNCGIINFNSNHVLMDFEDLFSIINFDKNFIHYYPEQQIYPYYLRHNQKITYLEHIFKLFLIEIFNFSLPNLSMLIHPYHS